MIRTFKTFSAARRAAPDGPILRLLADPSHLFVTGLSGPDLICTIDPRTGHTDGSISVFDLMAGGKR